MEERGGLTAPLDLDVEILEPRILLAADTLADAAAATEQSIQQAQAATMEAVAAQVEASVDTVTPSGTIVLESAASDPAQGTDGNSDTAATDAPQSGSASDATETPGEMSASELDPAKSMLTDEETEAIVQSDPLAPVSEAASKDILEANATAVTGADQLIFIDASIDNPRSVISGLGLSGAVYSLNMQDSPLAQISWVILAHEGQSAVRIITASPITQNDPAGTNYGSRILPQELAETPIGFMSGGREIFLYGVGFTSNANNQFTVDDATYVLTSSFQTENAVSAASVATDPSIEFATKTLAKPYVSGVSKADGASLSLNDPLASSMSGELSLDIYPFLSSTSTDIINNASQFVFIDHEIAESDLLYADAQRLGYQVIFLAPGQDLWAQVSSKISETRDVTAIHILTHGETGELVFGDKVYTSDNLPSDVIGMLSAHLTEKADILLYGCNIAGNQSGIDFISKLSFISGADVAASTDLTGSTNYGGNWRLEAQTGTIDTQVMSFYDYSGVLAGETPPVVSIASSKTVLENAAVSFLDNSATISDSDSPDFNGGRLTISGNAADDILDIPTSVSNTNGAIRLSGATVQLGDGNGSWTNIGTLSGGHSGNALTIDFTSSAVTPQVAQSILRSVTFYNNSDNPTSSRVLTTIIADGDGGTSLSRSTTVNITAVNDAPIVSFIGSKTVIENASASILNATATISDVDSADFSGGNITISGLATGDVLSISGTNVSPQAGNIYLNGSTLQLYSSSSWVNVGTVTGGSSGTNLVVSFTSNLVTPQVAEKVLQSITFYNNNDAPVASRTLAVTVNDGDGGTSSASSMTVLVEAVNDPPTLTIDASKTVLENAAASQLTATATVSDLDSANFAGGSVVVTGLTASDIVSISTSTAYSDGAIRLSGATVQLGSGGSWASSVDIGTFSGGQGLPATINFTSVAVTPSVASAVIKALTYYNNNDNPTLSRTLSVTLNDGDGGSALSQNITVSITAVNDAPAISDPATPITIYASSSQTSTPSGTVGRLLSSLFATDRISDPDGTAQADMGIAITSVASSSVLANVWITTNNGANWDNIGTIGANSAILLKNTPNTRFYFQSKNNQAGNSVAGVFSFRAWDGSVGSVSTPSGSGYTGTDISSGYSTALSSGTVAVNLTISSSVAPINNLPASYSVTEDTPLTLSGISITDSNAGSGTQSFTVKLSVALGSGTITAANGSSVTVLGSGTNAITLSGTLTNINTYLGSASYQPVLSPALNSNSQITLNIFTTNTTTGLIDSDNLSFTPSAVNDAATVDLNGASAGTSNAVTFTEGGTATSISPSGVLSDVDSTNLSSLTAVLTSRPDGDSVESLISTASVSGLTATYTASTGTLVISGSATVADYQTILRGIKYSNTSSRPDTTPRSITVKVNDGSLDSTSQQVSVAITSVNNPPVISVPLVDQSATENQPFSYQFASGSFTDPEGGTLSYAATLSDGSPLPSWLVFDATTRTFAGSGPAGSLSVKVTATDPQGASVADVFNITVVASTSGVGVYFPSVYRLTDNVGNKYTDYYGIETNDLTTDTSKLGGRNFYFYQSGAAGEFSGNNIPGFLTYIDNNGVFQSIAGYATRPVKAQGVAKGIYFVTDSDYQVDSGSGKTTTTGNTAYLLVIDENYFKPGTQYNSSSDSVSTALNTYYFSPSFTITGASATEGGTLVFTVSRDDASISGSVSYSTFIGTSDTASQTDFNSASGTLSFAVGELTKTFSVSTIQDTVYEPDETFSVQLSNASSGSRIATVNATGIILNDDSLPTFSVADSGAIEGGQVKFTVTRNGNAQTAQTVDYATSIGSGNTASLNDFTMTYGTLSFAVGETQKIFYVSTTDDAILESNETFTITLSNATGGALISSTAGTATGTIENDEGVVIYSISDATAVEGGVITFTIKRSGDAQSTQTISYRTSEGTASSDDFTAVNTSVTFLAGEFTKTISVQTTQDSRYENTENFTISLSNPSIGASVSSYQGSAAGYITNDDSAPTFSITGGSTAEGGSITFNVTRSGDAQMAQTVSYATVIGLTDTASQADFEAVSSYFTFNQGETSKTFSVVTLSDSLVEGYETFTGQLSSATGGASIATASATGTITENLPPVNSVPASITTLEDVAFSFVNSDTISVADVDTNLATVQLTVQYGILNVSLTGGASISSGANDSASLTLSGSQTQINAALATLIYLPNNNFYGSDSLTVVSTDSGGTTVPLTDTDVIAITVTPVNDAPSITAGGSLSYTENGTAAVIDAGIIISDVDDANMTEATVSIGSFVSGDVLGFTNQSGITGSYNAATGVLTLSGTATKAQYQAALRTVTFSSTSDNPTAGGLTSRTISWVVTDEGASTPASDALSSNTATSTITITPVNDAPSITAGGSLSYTENGTAAVIDAGIIISDVDDANMTEATVSIGSFVSGDVLGFTNQSGITGSYNAATGVLTLSGTATKAQYQAALRTVTFSSTSDNPTAGGLTSRTISWVVTDEGASTPASDALSSNTATSTITITPVNDAPVAVNDSYSVPEGGTSTRNIISNDTDAENSTLTISKVNGTAWGSLSASGSSTYTLSDGYKQVSTTNGVLYIKIDGSSVYVHNGSTTTSDSFTYTVTDGSLESNSATVGYTVTPVNTSPVSTDDSITVAEDSTTVLSLSDFGSYSDPEGTAISAVKITTLESAGSLEYYNGSSWVDVTLDQAITAADITASKLRYRPVTDAYGSPYAKIGFKVSDGTDYSTSAYTLTVNVTPVNDAPSITAGGSLSYTENGTAAVIDAGIIISDVDDANMTEATVSIGSFVSGDVLGFTNQSGITGSYNAATGVLTLSGTATKAQYQAALRTVTFSSTSDNPTAGGLTSRTISWVVTDEGASTPASDALSSNTATSTITITPVNDAPSITAGGSLSYTENGTAAVIDAGIIISDVDDANMTEATVSIGSFVSGDVLGFTNQSGITGSYNAATGVLTLSGTATKAQYQAALRTVTFSSTSDNPTAGGLTSRTISWVVTDEGASTPASDALSSNTATSTITITPVNDAPSITAGGSLSYTENGTAAVIDAGIIISDVDDANMTEATVSIGSFVSGDVLGFTNQSGITGSYNAATGVLTLSGTATKAQYQAALRTVTFSSTSDNPTAGGLTSRTISWVVTDEGASTPASDALSSNTATSTITITPVNDAPSITAGGSLSYTENGTAAVIDAGIIISDVDDANMTEATVSIGSFVSGDVLGFTNQSGITGSYNAATGVLTLSGTATKAQYQAALRTVTFSSTSDNPTAGGLTSRTISWVVTDEGASTPASDALSSNTATSTITITPVNDAPSITAGGSLSYTENGTAAVIDAGIIISDVDDANMTEATVSIGSFVSGDVLGFTNQSGITGSYNAATGVLTLSGTATKAQYQAALRTVTFSSTSDNPTAGGLTSRTISWVVTDEGASTPASDALSSNTATSTITITPVNDAPSITAGGSLSYTENGTAAVIDAGIIISDVDDANMTEATVSIGSFVSGDVLGFTNQSGITGSYNAATGVLTLSGTATKAQYQAALRTVTFSSTSDNPTAGGLTSRTISWVVTDEGASTPASDALSSNTATSTITITPVNDAPSITAGGSLSYTENGTAAVIDAGIIISDVDDANMTEATVSIGSFVSGDVLGFTNQSGITGSYNAATGVLTLSGTATKAQYQAALRTVTFSSTSDNPTAGGLTSRTISWVVTDEGASTPASDALSSNTATSTITITPVNDAPSITAGGSLSYTENGTAAVIDAGIIISDVDDANMTEATVSIGSFVSGDVLGFTNQSGITGSYNAATGVLTLSGTATKAQYQAALRTVTFSSTSDNPTAGGLTSRTISWVVTDEGASTPASDALSSNTATSTITITPVNDAPSITAGGSLSYTENGTAAVIDAGIIISDVDDANMTEATVSIGSFVSGDVLGFTNQSGITGSYNAATGVLTLSGTATKAQYQAALRTVTFSSTSDNPTAGGLTSRTISWVVTDEGASTPASDALSSNTATSTITITPVNDAPSITAGGSLSYTENGTAAVIDAGIIISDVDDANMTEATVSIGSFVSGDVLGFTNQSGITGSYNAATGVLTLSGTATKAQYQAALRTVTFSSTSDNPTAGGLTSRTISWVVTDEGASTPASDALSSNTATSTITITPVNDAPSITAGGSLSYTENGTAAVIDAGIIISDVDDANMTEATVSIGSFVSGDVLGFTNQSGITGSYNAATGVLTLSGTATKAQYQAALRTVTFSSTSDNPTAGGLTSRTISWVVTDEGASTPASDALSSNTATSTITITPVNDAPSITAGGSLSYTENGTAAVIDAGIIISDVDDANMTEATVSIGSFVSGDVLGFTNQSGITGSYNAATGVLTLSGTATKAQYQAALRTVTFSSTSDNPTAGGLTSRTISWVVTDEGASTPASDALSSNTATSTITITPVNDAPVSTDDSITVAEDSTTVLSLSDFGSYSDPEGTAISVVKITTLESAGSLEYYNGSSWVDVTLDQAITAADITAGKLRYRPVTDAYGSPYATIGFKVSDGTDYSTSAYTLTVNVYQYDTDSIPPEAENRLANQGGGSRGDLNRDGTADGSQNSVVTLAWIKNNFYEAGLNNTLTETRPIISASILDSSGQTNETLYAFDDVKILPSNDPIIGGRLPTELVFGSQTRQIQTPWDPIYFVSSGGSANALDAGTNDFDRSRPGIQVHVFIDISNSEIPENYFNGYVKYVSPTALAEYNRINQSLYQLDGQRIVSSGWYAFDRLTEGGDGAKYVVDNVSRMITGIDLIITDNAFGDNDPRLGFILDPGLPIFSQPSSTSQSSTSQSSTTVISYDIPTPGYSIGLSAPSNNLQQYMRVDDGMRPDFRPNGNLYVSGGFGPLAGYDQPRNLEAGIKTASNIQEYLDEGDRRIVVKAGDTTAKLTTLAPAFKGDMAGHDKNLVNKEFDNHDLQYISSKVTETDYMLVEHEIYGDGRDFTIKLHHKNGLSFHLASVMQRDAKPLPTWVKVNLDGRGFTGRLPPGISSLGLDVIIVDENGRSRLPVDIYIDKVGQRHARDGGQSVLRGGDNWNSSPVVSNSPAGLAPFSQQLRAAMLGAQGRARGH